MKYVGKDGLIINGSEVWHEGNFNPNDKLDKEEFDNLEIGRRNLILNSDFSQGLTNWTKTSNAISLEVGGGYRGDGLRLVITTAGTVTPRQRINLELMANDTLTGQVKVKTIQGNFSNMIMRVANQLTIPLVSVKQLDNDWELYTYRVTVSSPITLSNNFGFYNTTGEFIIDEIKLERGNKATDWTPAPEDIQAEIDKKADKTELPTKLSQLTKDINFDERYYTETEVNTKLDGKVDNSRVLTDVPANAKFTDTITTINGKTGAIAKADIVALGIPAQDTVYTHPANHPASMITESTTKRFVSDTEKNNWNSKAEISDIPTRVGQLQNDKNYVTQAELGSAGYGDMMKAIYDTNNNGIVDNAEKVNGFTVEANVPANAKFTDTIYTHPSTHPVSMITGLHNVATSGIADKLSIVDTRSVDSPPSYYFGLGRNMFWEFKYRSSVGNPPTNASASGTYAFILTITGWTDSSGGYPVQVSVGGSNLAIRQGTSTSAWGPWYVIANISDLPIKLSQLTKDINFDERYYTETEIDTKLNGKANISHTHTANDLPNGTTSAKGIVQLSTSTSSTSTSLAATASAVKQAYDLANSKTKIVKSATQPTGLSVGDVWIQTI